MDEFKLIDLAAIQASTTNPRKTFDSAKLTELAASIKEKGVLQPILVRPISIDRTTKKDLANKGKLADRFELVAGERRYRAANIAGLTQIPAMVRVLDDKQVVEIQAIENDQREDVPPLEQALGYQQLIDQGYDVAMIAAKIGRGTTYVYARLTLTKLIKPLQKDVAAGKLPFAHASLMARLTPEQQKEMSGDDRGRNLYDWDDSVTSLTELKNNIRHHLITDLRQATWDLESIDLVPTAGSCTACPKRERNAPNLFDGIENDPHAPKGKSDRCLDSACFHKKREALIELKLRETKTATGVDPIKVSTDYYSSDKSVVTCGSFKEVSPAAAKKLTEKERAKLKPAVVVKGEGAGKVVQVLVTPKRAAYCSSSDAKYKQERKIGNQIDLAIARRAFDAYRTEGVITDEQEAALAVCVVDQTWHDARKALAKELGCELDDLHERIRTGDPLFRFGCLAFVALIKQPVIENPYDEENCPSNELAKQLGVSYKKVAKQVRAANAKPPGLISKKAVKVKAKTNKKRKAVTT